MSDIPGMTEGIEAIRILFQGSEVLFRTTGSIAKWSYENLIRFATFIFRLCKTQKDALKPGEIQFNSLMKKGELGIMQINNEDMDNFINYAEKIGLTYAIMPDLNKKDSCFEVAYLEKQGTAARYYIAQNPEKARSYTFVEYHNNADTEEIEKTLESLDKDALLRVDKLSYTDIIKQEGLSIELDSSFFVFDDITGKETIKVGIPNEDNRYIEISKSRLSRIAGDKRKILIAMLQDEEFNVVNKEGNHIIDENGLPEKIKAINFKGKTERMQVKKKKDPNKTQVRIINSEKDGQVSTLIREIHKNVSLDKIATPAKIIKPRNR